MGRALGSLGRALAFLLALETHGAPANSVTNGEFIVQSWNVSEGAPAGPIGALAQTSDGFLWVASTSGMARYDGSSFRPLDASFIASHGPVQRLVTDADHSLWAITSSNHLGRLHHQQWEWLDTHRGVPNRGLHGVYSDGSGGVIVSDTVGGVYRIRERRLVPWLPPHPQPPGPFMGINTDFNGGVWVRHGFVLSWWTGAAWQPLQSKPETKIAPALKTAPRQQGGMWISTSEGIGIFTEGVLELDRLRYPKPIHGVQAMLEDRRGNVWMATGGHGLVHFDSHEQYHLISEAAGTPLDAIRSLYEDIEGTVWVGTASSGIYSFRPVADPLTQSPRPTSLPHVSLLALRADGHRVDTSDSRNEAPAVETLAPGTRVLEIEYGATLLSDPNGLHFRRKLSGRDLEWLDTGTARVAAYTNLPPGHYELRVAAGLDHSEVWGEASSPLRFIVAPQWWQSWRFRTGLLLSLLGSGVLAYGWRATSRKRAQAARRTLAQQLLTSQETERQRIAADLHDSLGQQLLLIKNSAQLALERPRTESVAVEHLEMISSLSTQCLDEIRRLSRHLHPYQLDQMGLTKALRALATQVAQSSSLCVKIDLDELEDALPKEAEISLYRIVQEGLSNVVKHAGAKTVWLTVERNGREVSIQLLDDGHGFDPSSISTQGFGLSSMRERVAMLAGTLSLTSRTGGGMSLVVQIPTMVTDHEN